MIIHDISLKQFNDLTFEVRKKLQIEIEAAICPVLMKFFEKDALGRDTWPEIYRLQNEIEENILNVSWDIYHMIVSY